VSESTVFVLRFGALALIAIVAIYYLMLRRSATEQNRPT
jgi:hypothetical protein